MRYLLLKLSTFGAVAAFAAGTAYANDTLIKMSGNPNDWVMPARTYDAQRYSRSSKSTPQMSASCRPPGRSRPAFCVVTKARRW